MRIKVQLTVLSIGIASMCGCHAKVQTYPSVQTQVRQALGIPSNQNLYIGSFSPSIGTMFCSGVLSNNPPVNPATCLLADSSDWFSPSVTQASRTTLLAGIIKQEPSLGKFSATGNLTSDVSANASFPLIGRVFSANGSLDVGKTSKVSMSGDSAYQEIIAWNPLRDAAKANELSDSTQKLLLSSDYVLVVSDYVVTNFNATLEEDPNLSAQAKASLEAAIGSLAKDASAGVTVTRKGSSSITVTADKVIVASVLSLPPPHVLEAAGPDTTASEKGAVVSDPSVLRSLVMNKLQKEGRF